MFFFFKQKTAYEMRISDWSSDVCSSDLLAQRIKEADFIVPDAVKARPGGKAGCGDVQTAPAQLQEASSARPCCAQPQLRHFVADPVLVLDRPVLDLVPCGIERRAVIKKPHRAEARRVGEECVSTFNFLGLTYH